jgi:ATP-dependent helicase/nuclease subunit B
MHYTVKQLAEIDERYPTARKLLLVPTLNFGRELLASLARARGCWVGWEVATLATVASELSVMELARRGRRRASDVAIADAVSVAFERAVQANAVSPALAALSWSAGTRRAIADAILEARVAGVTEAALNAVAQFGVASSLAAVLQRYEVICAERALADTADMFDAALMDFNSQSAFVLDHAVMVAAPGWTVRGAPRLLFERMVQRGLHALPSVRNGIDDTPHGLVDKLAPAWRSGEAILHKPLENNAVSSSPVMFCAMNSADELRSVVRQALAGGYSMDDVEIACTDRDNYAIILDALCQQIGVSCTIADGLPLGATRIGRACERWLGWIESGFHASILREALESGDFTVGGSLAPTQLSAELRKLKIGWGLDATRRASRTLRSKAWADRMRPFESEADDAFAARRARRLELASELARVLDALIAIAPEADAMTSAATLATRTVSALALVQPRGAGERSTAERLLERLAEVAAVDGSPMSLSSAIASLRQELAGLRAWTDSSKTTKPRRATGGHLHLTSIENAGATGRPLQFIVGLDADRTAGPVMQSPLFPDSLRLRLNERGADLPTTEQRRQERAWQLGNAIAGTYQRLTLSYAVHTSAESRESGPAAALLEAARNRSGNHGLSYGELRALLGAPRSAVPIVGTEQRASDAPSEKDASKGATNGALETASSPTPEVAIDARDTWLAAMGEGPILLDATEALCASFSGLQRGQTAVGARTEPLAGAFHGLVPDAGVLDPRATGHAISPSSLERVARCGLNWFYSVALNARVPDDPVYDPVVWLNAMDRGSALHRIYEVLIRTRVHEQNAGASRDASIGDVVQQVAREVEAIIPAPADTVRAREIAALLEEAALFVNTEHAAFEKEPWETVALESQFGGENDSAVLPLANGQSLRMHGRVDRVDKLRDGTLRLVDYKTGKSFELDNKRGVFDGGRKLQLALYSPAISAQLHAVVAMAEYRFPTAKGDGGVARADEAMLQAAPRIVQSLLDDVAAGRFLPTLDASDCRFCEYATVCRVTVSRFDSHSPRAAWAKENNEVNVHYDGVRQRRLAEDDA